MATEVTQVLVSGRTSPPGQVVTLTDHATNTVVGSTTSDPVTGAWSIPCPFGLYLEAIAEAFGAATAAPTLAQPGTAGGQAGAGGTLSQSQPLVGSADGAATAGASALDVSGETQSLSGSAGGTSTGGASALDGDIPSVGTLTVPDTTGTSITGISASATDAVGVIAWMIKEAASDSFTAPVAGDSGWTSVTSTTSFSSSSLTFTSSATETGTRYFRIYFKDAAGNVGASATDSATITISAGITVVGTGTYGSGSVTLPSGIQSGDIIVILSDGVPGGSISGYTRKLNYAGSIGLEVYWKRATGSDSGSISLNAGRGACMAFHGCVASGDPWDAIESSPSPSSTGAGATSCSDTAAEITTATNNAMVLLMATALDRGWDDTESAGANISLTWGSANGAATTVGASGSTQQDQYRVGAGIWYATKPTAGATGTGSVGITVVPTWAGYEVGQTVVAILGALKPA